MRGRGRNCQLPDSSSIQQHDGSGPWQDFHAHFEACVEISGWKYIQKGSYLAVSLRGNAQGVLGNLPKGSNPDCQSLERAHEERFAPPSQTELYRVQMRERYQRVGESLPALGQAIFDLQIWHTLTPQKK